MIGAGSAVFARTVITDILAVDGLDTGVFALVESSAARGGGQRGDQVVDARRSREHS